jgi:L-rhamnose mutarotase
MWPDVLAQIARSSIRNYSIYRYGDLLFLLSTSATISMPTRPDGLDPATQRW